MEEQASQQSIDLSCTEFECSTDLQAVELLAALKEPKSPKEAEQKATESKKVTFLGITEENTLKQAFEPLRVVTAYLRAQAESSGQTVLPPSKVVSGLMSQKMALLLHDPSRPAFSDVSKVRLLAFVLKSKTWRPTFKAFADEQMSSIGKVVTVLRKSKTAVKINDDMKRDWLQQFASFLSKGKAPAQIEEETLQVAQTFDGVFTDRDTCCKLQNERLRLVEDVELMVDEIFRLMRCFSPEHLSKAATSPPLEPLTLNEHLVLCCYAVCIKERYDIFVVKFSTLSRVGVSLSIKPALKVKQPADQAVEAAPIATVVPKTVAAPLIEFPQDMQIGDAIKLLKEKLVESRTLNKVQIQPTLVACFTDRFQSSEDRLVLVQSIFADKALSNVMNLMRVRTGSLMPAVITNKLTRAEAQLEANYIELLAKWEPKVTAYNTYFRLKLERFEEKDFTSNAANDLSHYFKTVLIELADKPELVLTDKMALELMHNHRGFGRRLFIVLALMFPKLFLHTDPEELSKLRDSCIGQSLQRKTFKTSTQASGDDQLTKTLFKYQLSVDPKQIIEHVDFFDCWLNIVSKLGNLRDKLLSLVQMSVDMTALTSHKPMATRIAMVEFIACNGANLLPYGGSKKMDELQPKVELLESLEKTYKIGFSYSQRQILVVDPRKKEDLLESIKMKGCLVEKLANELEAELALWHSMNKVQQMGVQERGHFGRLEFQTNRLLSTINASNSLWRTSVAPLLPPPSIGSGDDVPVRGWKPTRQSSLVERLSNKRQRQERSPKSVTSATPVKLMACHAARLAARNNPKPASHRATLSGDLLNTSAPILSLLN